MVYFFAFSPHFCSVLSFFCTKGIILSQFRNIAGGYPVIEKFVDTIKTLSVSPGDEL